MSRSNRFLIVLDFLSQKYEVEYEENMLAQDVIRKLQRLLFPSEQSEDLIPNQNEESYKKLCLYRAELSNPMGFKGAAVVSWNIKPNELDFNKYRFFIYRPIMNVYLTMYVVFPDKKDKKHSIAYLNFIYPIKKRGIVLKNHLKDKLIEHAEGKEAFKNIKLTGLRLEFIIHEKSRPSELADETYTEQWMNGKEMYLIISPENNINQNSCSLGRFYYYSFGHVGQSRSILDKEGGSLDYDDKTGITLNEAKKKLIEKHQAGNNYPEEKVVVLFNGTVQTYKYTRLDDLFSDNDFYQFVVIFESDINKHIPQVSQSDNREMHKLYIPDEARPNILKLEIIGEPKRELRQRAINSGNKPVEPSHNESNFMNELHITDNNSQDNTPEPSIDDGIDLDNSATSNDNEAIYSNLNNFDHNNTDNHINTNSDNDSINTNNNQSNGKLDTQINNDSSINNDEKDEDTLLDMFCYYFLEFSKENHKLESKTPHPTYFNSNNLSDQEINLINTFKKYYSLYRESKH